MMINAVLVALIFFFLSIYANKKSTTSSAKTVNNTNNLSKTSTKAAVILQLTGVSTDYDLIIQQNLKYIYTQDDYIIPIIDGGATGDSYLSVLQSQYNKGVRIFIGMSSSDLLEAVLPWFLSHPDVIGFSTVSNSSNLNVKKNIIRMNINQTIIMNNVISFIKPYSFVQVIAEPNLVFATSAIPILEKAIPPSQINILTASPLITSDQTKITNTINSLPSNSILVLLNADTKNQLLTTIQTLPSNKIPTIIDAVGDFPTFDHTGTLVYNNKYNLIAGFQNYSLNIQQMARANGFRFNDYIWDCYNLARAIAEYNLNFQQDYPYFLYNIGPLILDQNNDRVNGTTAIFNYSAQNWTIVYLYGQNSQLGSYQSSIKTSSVFTL